jgi:hypothetical protein
MTKAQATWTKQHNQLHARLGEVATIVTFEDGTQGIMPGTAPASLMAAYRTSMTVGAAKGWL